MSELIIIFTLVIIFLFIFLYIITKLANEALTVFTKLF